MKVYKFDEEGYFAGEHDCQVDPINGGFLYPSRYLTTKPPEITDQSEFVKENNGSWIVEPSFLTKDIWSKVTGAKIKCPTKEIPEGYTDIEKPDGCYSWDASNWSFDLSAYKLLKRDELKTLIKENWIDIDKTMDQLKTQWANVKVASQSWTTKEEVDETYNTAVAWLGLD